MSGHIEKSGQGHAPGGKGSEFLGKLAGLIGKDTVEGAMKAGPLGAVESEGGSGSDGKKHDDHHKPAGDH